MTAINLSGIQSISVPTDIKVGDEVTVLHDSKNPYQSPNEPALIVKHEGRPIGFIPVLSTIERYIAQAREENNLKQYEYHSSRKAAASAVRYALENDMFRNHLIPIGKICRLQVDEDSGKVLSVSVMFNYM